MPERKTGEYRLDVKVPEVLYAEIEKLARESGAKEHHISKRPIVKDTVLELLKIGLAHYGEAVPDTDTRNLADTGIIDSRIQAAIAPLLEEIEAVKKPLAL